MYTGSPPPSSVAHCVTRVQINISCRNLRDKDVMSKSDPMAVVLMLSDIGWTEVFVFLQLRS